MDSQSVKAAETVSRDTRGYDSPTRAQDNGRKRHLIVDTKGLLMTVKVTAADITDRDAAREMLPELRKNNPELTLMWADNAYTGLTDWARNELDLTFKVVKTPFNRPGFDVIFLFRHVVSGSLTLAFPIPT